LHVFQTLCRQRRDKERGQYPSSHTEEYMRRAIFAVVSGAMGALVGLLFVFLTGRTAAIFICAILGAAASFAVKPGAAKRIQ
jgi:hypothetical protein